MIMYTLNYYMLFYFKISQLTYYKFFILSDFKLNYSTNLRRTLGYFILILFMLFHIIFYVIIKYFILTITIKNNLKYNIMT
jgi:hypothetical protein